MVIKVKKEYKEKYKKLGLKISYYRRLKNFTQETLAEALEINATFLGQVECGVKGISLDNLFKISEVLEISTKKFFDFEDD